MPVITVLCMYYLPVDFRSDYYILQAGDAALEAMDKAAALRDARKSKQMNDLSIQGGFSKQYGFFGLHLDLDVVFSDKDSWDHYRDPEHYAKLYKRFDQAIKKVYGSNWNIMKNEFKPDYPKKYVPDDRSYPYHLVVQWTDPSKPKPYVDPNELD